MPISEKESKLIDSMLGGDRVALARLITLVENRHSSVFEILKRLNSRANDIRSGSSGQARRRGLGPAYIIGLTGPPGAGKSSLVNELIVSFRKKDKRIGVIAVDPSSPFTGGAVLGDRIRMQDHALDQNVFIRSLGTRGSHGGLSRATKEIIKLYDAFGMDYIMIETVGVGQTELDIIQLADTVIVVLVPEAGDVVQTMKAGLMEIGDIFVVNKADREGADKIIKEIRFMTSIKSHEDGWEIPVVPTSMLERRGINELVEEIEKHMTYQSEHGVLEKKREKRREEDFSRVISELIERKVSKKLEDSELKRMLDLVKKGEIDPYEGADLVVSKIL